MNTTSTDTSDAPPMALYAAHERASRGRVYPASVHPFRSLYQRDRARVIHSTAFRRLQYKTQVFVVHEGDHYRTRLTHSLEAAQIARTVARALRLNEDLADTIALAHDLGHPPFGHSGEHTMNALMRDGGGFGHNAQGLRIVDLLESRYHRHPGLNLTYEVREAFVRHPTKHGIVGCDHDFDLTEGMLLETQVTVLADEIAYGNHDLDDGLASGILREDDLRELSLWQRARAAVGGEYAALSPALRRTETIRRLVDMLVTDLIQTTAENIAAHNITSLADVRAANILCVAHSSEIQSQKDELNEFLYENFYQHDRVVVKTKRAEQILATLFSVYMKRPEQLPENFRERLQTTPQARVVCDYIAGMTDTFAETEFQRLRKI